MPGKKGTKFRTVHKFGKKRKRRSSLKQTQDNTAEPSAPVATTSSASPSLAVAASVKKIDLFRTLKKRKTDVSDPEQPHFDPEPQNMNFIVNLQALNELLSPVRCEECGNAVS
jgi:hypothetical protein